MGGHFFQIDRDYLCRLKMRKKYVFFAYTGTPSILINEPIFSYCHEFESGITTFAHRENVVIGYYLIPTISTHK